MQTYSGVAEAIAQVSGTRGGSLFTVLDVLGGAMTALGITVALLHRRLLGGGVTIESSLLDAADHLMQITQSTARHAVLSGLYATIPAAPAMIFSPITPPPAPRWKNWVNCRKRSWKARTAAVLHRRLCGSADC